MIKTNIKYPVLEFDLIKFKNNVEQVVSRCAAQGISVAGVIKGFSGIPEGAAVFAEAGCDFIASSRLEQIKGCRDFGIKKEYMLIRIPMLSEIPDVIRLTDISLNSDMKTLEELNQEAIRQGKVHKVILMVDLGDLREGFWDQWDLLAAALFVEHQCDGLYLSGIGTNLGCYGSIVATPQKMDELVNDAEMIENEIGRKLDIISGGATSSFPLVLNGMMPKRINNLRVGEGIILAKDLKDLYGLDMSFMYQDAFVLKAQIIELKNKPTYPVGELSFDAFGHVGTYEDQGIRKRALLGLGKVDVAYTDMIYPRDEAISIIGASSDHFIIDVEDTKIPYEVGDVISFDLCYASLVFATNSPNVQIVCKP